MDCLFGFVGPIRISKYKRKTFERGHTPNWTEEVFIIDKIQYTNPIAYKTKDLSDKGIKGSFYTELKNYQKPHKMFSEVMRCFQMRLFGEITRRNKLW